VAIQVPTTLWLGPNPEDELQVEIVDASTSGVRIVVPRGKGHSAVMGQLKDRNIYFYPHLADSPHLAAPVLARVMTVQSTPDGHVLGLLMEAKQDLSAQQAIAQLIFGDSETWHRVRASSARGKGMLSGFGYVFLLFAKGFPALVGDLLREPSRRRTVEVGPDPDNRRPAHLLAFGVDLDAISRDAAAARYDTARPDTVPGAARTMTNEVPG